MACISNQPNTFVNFSPQGVEKEVHIDCPLFLEPIPYPGFIEFDDVNGGIFTMSNSASTFTFWSMKDMKKCFEIRDAEFQETRLSNGTITFFKYVPEIFNFG
eukprot:GHVH01005743.1.p2 GENE.GHVH01005743.1~~GHVH01005743.1.p2  ORF type:complete len:102 (+),score=14.65 GHVH01005743.1:304-609(+)